MYRFLYNPPVPQPDRCGGGKLPFNMCQNTRIPGEWLCHECFDAKPVSYYRPRFEVLEGSGGDVAGYEPPVITEHKGFTSAQHGRCTIPDSRLEPYFGDLVEGGIVIDKRPCAKLPEFALMVMSSPMLKLGITEPDLCPVPNEMFVGALEGSFKTLAAIKLAKPTFTGLDHVGLADYLAVWRSNGARIGVKQGGNIYWEHKNPDGDGGSSPIPVAARRFLNKP